MKISKRGHTPKTVKGKSKMAEKSFTADKTQIEKAKEINELEAQWKELNEKAGENPMPNREGNENTKALNNPLSLNTVALADKLKKILKDNRVTGEERKVLADVEKELRGTEEGE